MKENENLTAFGRYLQIALIIYLVLYFTSKPLFYADLFSPPYP